MPDDSRPVDRLHNRPPVVDFYREQNELLPGFLEAENTDLLERAVELSEAFARAPAVIETDEVAGKMADFTKQVAACIKHAESKRTGDKEPLLNGGRIVDGFYKTRIIDGLDRIKKQLSDRQTIYLRKKAEAERRAREEAERKAREEAEAAARAAAEAEAKAQTDADLDGAVTAEALAKQKAADALKAQQAADAKSAELSRTRGDYGAVASLRTEWAFEVLDRAKIDLEALRPYLPIDGIEKAIRGAMKAGVREISGVKIYQREVAAIR